MAVIACAGSGKTTTLIKRVVKLLEDGVDPEQTAIITFTVKAAEELRLRLAKSVANKQTLSQLFIGTIHAFCRHLLTQYFPEKYETLEILSDVQQLALLSAKRNEWEVESISPDLFGKSKGVFFRSLQATFDIIKQERLDTADLGKRYPALIKAYNHYLAHLETNNLADYNDLLRLTLKFFDESEQFRDSIRKRAKWLFVDEYQDVDPIQHELMLKIADGGNLCIIGDDDQAIYQFRGTDCRNFISQLKPEKNREVFILDTNFRCRDNIVKNGIEIVKKISVRAAKPMRSNKNGGLVKKQAFPSVADEASFIASEIKNLKQSGRITRYGDCAILLRSVSSYGIHYLNALITHNIPFRTRGDGSLFDDSVVRMVVAAIEFISQQDTKIENLQIIAEWFPIKPDKSVTDWTELSNKDLANGGLNTEQIRIFREWEQVRTRYQARKFSALLELLLDIIGSIKIFTKNNYGRDACNLGTLTELVGQFDITAQTKNMQFLSGFFAMHSDRIADQTFQEEETDAVDVLTVHQAKGLQYSTVFLPMLCEGRFPNEGDEKRLFIKSDEFDSQRYLGTLDDERRLFYVAVTRAADSLYASYAKDVGLKKPKNASIFYHELKESHLASEIQSIDSIPSSELPLITSYSSLELYLSCPFRYQLSKVYGIATPPNPFYEFGRTLHQVLRHVHTEYKAGREVLPSQVEAIYDSYFKLRLYVPKVTIMLRRKAGIAAIIRYIKNRKDWLGDTMATEKDFSLLLGNTVLKGRLDLLLGNEKSCQIVDYKTGSRHEYIDTGFQIGLYALVGKEHFGWDVDKCKICYIEHDEIVNYDVNQEILDKTHNKFDRVVNGIRKLEFSPTPGAVCTRCEYKKICPYSV